MPKPTFAKPTRRGFLAGLLAAGAAPNLGWAAAGNPAFLAAAKAPDGGFVLAGLGADGTACFSILLPARGHAGAAHPSRALAVVFARRPGTYALVIDCAAGQIAHHISPPAGMQFNGHGVFAYGGALLATSQQRASDSAGFIGLWDAANSYTYIGHFPSHGIGPHEVLLMPDGDGIVVANGGIATDPADRSKLNIATMRPNLAYLSLAGMALEIVELPTEFAQNSIRHLALGRDGLTGFAMQWEGLAGADVPLLGLHQRGAPPILAQTPITEAGLMRGYAGSVAFSGAGDEIAITSPKGGRMQRFDPSGAFIAATARADICGIAPRAGGYLASDGFGGLVALGKSSGRLNAVTLGKSTLAWDNHILALPQIQIAG